MQMLYTMGRDPELAFSKALRRYEQSIEQSYILFLFNMHYLAKISAYALKDADRRSSKHLPTEEDKTFTTKLVTNDLTQAITSEEDYAKLIKKYHLDAMIDTDVVRKMYTEFSKKEEYKEYLSADATNEMHQKILLGIYKHCYGHELFNEAMEDQFPGWIDDKSLVVGTTKKALKALPGDSRFFETFHPPEETTHEFGEALLKSVHQSDELLLSIIEPNLKNWDADRVAVIDMILLKMALSELMIFPTIPTKVTLNEFVEISKLYSTEKSKDFINGILDRLLKKLEQEGKINKEGRGLVE